MLQKSSFGVFYPCLDYRITNGFLRFQNCIYINRVPIHIIGEALFLCLYRSITILLKFSISITI